MAEGLRKRKRGHEEEKGDLNIFEWNIASFTQGFRKIGNDKNEKITSPVFVGKSVELPNSFWHIDVYPKDKDDGVGGKHLGLHLVLIEELNEHNPVVKVKSKFSLLNGNQKEVASYGEETVDLDTYGPEQLRWGCLMVTHSELLNHKNRFLDDDVLRIRIKVWIQNDQENATTTKRKCDELHKNFSQLFASSICSDVEIVIEDVTLRAHKGILACRSPVFAAMFQNDMSESLTNTVKIEDFSSKTVKEMLKFIYSGSVECVEEDFVELLKIAEKYELRELKLACTKAAILKISVENAIELLIIGDMYNAPELKSKAMAFINDNKANPMFSRGHPHGALENLAKEHPLLVLDMYQSVLNKDNEEVTRFTTDLND